MQIAWYCQFLPFIPTQCKYVQYIYIYIYIYHLLPPTCFGVCYTIVRETVVLFAPELCFSEVCHPRCVFKLYGEVKSVKNTTLNITTRFRHII